MQMNTSYIYRTGTALLLLLAAAAGAPAQERWSLKQCIDHAIANNITIRQTANQAEQSRVDVNTAKWARLPSLNGSAGQSWSWGRSQTAVADEPLRQHQHPPLHRAANPQRVCPGQAEPASLAGRPGQSQGGHRHQHRLGLPASAVQQRTARRRPGAGRPEP